jgi:hypothetical protein
MFEYKIKGMVGGNAVEGIEIDHLIQPNQVFDIGTDVVIKFTQVDINSLTRKSLTEDLPPINNKFKWFRANMIVLI